ncbi:MAG: hypothetical protein K0V04_03340 [Deltaproteobacteria bacterium]|nr:hypothetical protein [Deltaproteobacteria bacterium]
MSKARAKLDAILEGLGSRADRGGPTLRDQGPNAAANAGATIGANITPYLATSFSGPPCQADDSSVSSLCYCDHPYHD